MFISTRRVRKCGWISWFVAPLFVALLWCASRVGADAAAPVIDTLDKPFLFAYESWKDKVRIENGRAILRGEGVTAKGGAGQIGEWDLSASPAFSPALRLKVGAANTAKTLRLMLKDDKETAGTWDYPLPPANDSFVVVTPKDGAPFSNPNALDKPNQTPNLARIRQWQLIGDWSATVLDIEVEEILSWAPDAVVLQQRKVLADKQIAEREALARERTALRERYKPGAPTSPQVVSTSLVGPDMLSIVIQAGRVQQSTLTPYQAQTGDEKDIRKDEKGAVRQIILKRGGQEFGWLIGPKRDQLVTFERIEGDPLLEFAADEIANYQISSPDDAAYQQAKAPLAAHRKTKPTNWALPGKGFAKQHRIYLKVPQPLQAGKRYLVSLGGLNTRQSQVEFRPDATKVLSEAIHVHQIGYRPDDPIKRAFLSVWLGTGGAYRYPDGLKFSLVDDKSGKAVFSGAVEVARRVEDAELMFRNENFNKTDVLRMDFGSFKTPGRYRVSVEGIGCSYPFEIGNDVWRRAFLTQMRGLFHQRSGMDLGPPYTSYRKPRDFHVANGDKIFQSNLSAEVGPLEGAEIEKQSTGKPAPEAWGGYHDAGDWNPRRATHLRVTMAQLEMFDLFPKYFGALKLNIPPTKGVPDVLTEALWEIDCFRRLQLPDGSVRYGIETSGDPIDGEVSWLQSMPVYVFAPDIYSTYIYAAAAGRVARLLRPFDAKLAAVYHQSALKAMSWAEADWDKRKAANTLDKLRWEARDSRNLAALEMYALTRDAKWHAVFKENSFLADPNGKIFAWGQNVQRDAAFMYTQLDPKLTDATMRERAVRALVGEAELALKYASGNAWNITTPDKGKPMFLGFYSTPDAIELARAHFLTGDSKYLGGAVQATQFQAGCNPNNMTYTTGLGVNPPMNPLKLDSRRSGQAAPEGITVYGNVDFVHWNAQWITWPMNWHLNKECTPPANEWPIPEAYWDIFLFVAQNEYTVDVWAPNVWVWGYLAARP